MDHSCEWGAHCFLQTLASMNTSDDEIATVMFDTHICVHVCS